MNVVMFVLSGNDRCYGVRFCCGSLSTNVTELSAFLLETSLDGLCVSVTMFTVFNTNHTVLVLLGQNLTVLYWLNRGVVMILVNFTINGSLGLFMTLLDDVLLHDGGSNLLVDCGVMITSFVPKK